MCVRGVCLCLCACVRMCICVCLYTCVCMNYFDDQKYACRFLYGKAVLVNIDLFCIIARQPMLVQVLVVVDRSSSFEK